MKSILHLTDKYLPLTNTFTYDEVKYLKLFKPIFLVSKIENLEVFPFPRKQIYKIHYFLIKNKFYYINSKIKEKTLNIIRLLLDPILWPIVKIKLRKIIKENNVKLIHCHWGTNAPGFLKIKEYFKLPMVTFFYGHDVSIVQKSRKKSFYKCLFKKGDLFLTESRFLGDKLIKMGCPENKLIILRQGIDLNDFRFNPKKLKKGEKIKILTVGRFTEMKGIEYAVQAFAESCKKHSNIELRLMGDGELRPKIESLIDNLKIRNKVVMLGMQPYNKLVEEMLGCHIFMLPSVTSSNGDTEGQGTVFLQAQAIGVPVVSTLHNGIPEAVINGKSGFLVPERDYIALSSKLNYLIENPETWFKMGQIGRKNIEENFEVKKQTKKLEEIYQKLINNETK